MGMSAGARDLAAKRQQGKGDVLQLREADVRKRHLQEPRQLRRVCGRLQPLPSEPAEMRQQAPVQRSPRRLVQVEQRQQRPHRRRQALQALLSLELLHHRARVLVRQRRPDRLPSERSHQQLLSPSLFLFHLTKKAIKKNQETEKTRKTGFTKQKSRKLTYDVEFY